VLARNLIAAGIARPAASAAHHMVAGNAPQAAQARAVLARFDIDINSAANGIFLPANQQSANFTGSAVHSVLHTNDYYRAVNDALGAATSQSEALDILARIRESLLRGSYP
jgi:hypothetical protein